ncbi:MAG: hypothetical protein ACFB4I_05730 [Cyanophyceae cyanobacterium]
MATSSTQLAPPQSRSTSKPLSEPLPPAQILNLAASHANGTRLQITKIAFAQDHIVLEISVTNDSETAIALNQSETILQDNLGNIYEIIPPPENPRLEILPGETISGTLTFLGRIAPSAASLKLIANQNGSNSHQASNPTIITNIFIQ